MDFDLDLDECLVFQQIIPGTEEPTGSATESRVVYPKVVDDLVPENDLTSEFVPR